MQAEAFTSKIITPPMPQLVHFATLIVAKGLITLCILWCRIPNLWGVLIANDLAMQDQAVVKH